MKTDFGCQAYEHTFEVYPLRWYERISLRMFFAALFTPLLTLVQSKMGIPPDLRLSLFGVVGWVTFLFADSLTTAMVMRLKPEFDRRGQEFPTYEQNRLLPLYPTLQNQVLSLTTLIALGGLPLVFLAPTVALFALFIEGGQAITNLRIWFRLRLALQYIERARRHMTVHHQQAIRAVASHV